ncbi:MAG: EAL domain-containing protein [Magnetospirillum sp.]|nr:EAL domain-containing protein [Magnetospirillum sp.]
MQSLTLLSGQVLFSEGDEAERAFLVEEGLIEIFVERQGHTHPVALLGPGEIFGEMGVIDGSPRSAGARALRDCQLLVVTASEFHGFLARGEAFHAELLGKLVARLRNAQKALSDGGLAQPVLVSEPGVGPGFAVLRQERDIADAIGRGEFEPYLQAIVDLRTGRPLGFEALARWCSSRHGVMAPFEFLPLAERSGLIRPIDLVMAERALLACAALTGTWEPFISVNLSALHFRDGESVRALATILDASGIDPQRVRLELTESLMLGDPDAALKTMTALKSLGVQLALDDFGTGYSSLNILHRMPIDVIKVDKGLVDGARESGKRRSVLKAIVVLAAELGMSVIAEGVEDIETADNLIDLGYVMGQGFLYARPEPAERALARRPAA